MANSITDVRLALLWGGWSDEREISRSSAEACAKALADAGFEDVTMLDVADEDFFTKISSGGYDVAFIAMHGAYGEDGSIQGLCEVLHLPYTFSGVLASAMASDKDISKIIYEKAGIPTPKGIAIARGESYDVDEVLGVLGLPVFVKPAVNGSSYGVTKVYEKDGLIDAVNLALESSEHALVEEFVAGTEITVPVLGNDDAQALPIVEIVTGADFYDLKVKYEPTELHHVIPARLPEDVYARAAEYAVKAHRALGCAGASRSDFIVTDEGVPVILETNTIPGMTESSLLPDSAAHAGIAFPELCSRFVELALETD
jgi:D-alanine-D-alanine ligase